MEGPFYKLHGFWWTSDNIFNSPSYWDIKGPYCQNCYIEVEFPDEAYTDVGIDYPSYQLIEDWVGIVECPLCHKKKKITTPVEESKKEAALKIKSGYRSTLSKISLEEPITNAKVRDQDDKYFIAAKMGQKDGKRVGVVYFGEKNRDQKKEDYSQIFIDLDEEQLRFDKSNKHPKDILSKFTAEFPDSMNTTKTKKLGKS